MTESVFMEMSLTDETSRRNGGFALAGDPCRGIRAESAGGHQQTMWGWLIACGVGGEGIGAGGEGTGLGFGEWLGPPEEGEEAEAGDEGDDHADGDEKEIAEDEEEGLPGIAEGEGNVGRGGFVEKGGDRSHAGMVGGDCEETMTGW